jgi:hypothetical protein
MKTRWLRSPAIRLSELETEPVLKFSVKTLTRIEA